MSVLALPLAASYVRPEDPHGYTLATVTTGSEIVSSGAFAGRYVIEREVGRGATATVYLARDLSHQRPVAIKILSPELAQSLAADRFLREIDYTRKLSHPHILPILDSGEAEGQLFFVLPFMEEGTLRARLQRDKQLPVVEATTITTTIAEALEHAHRQGIIHRDIKPENILFTSGQAVLADFGIARALEQAMGETTTSSGLVRGTPAYMSPEQASGGQSYDGRTDIYSLGCVLYEMIAGIPAFIGPTPESVIAQRFQHSPRDISVYRPAISPAMADVVERALQLAPADRFQTAAEFARALRDAASAPASGAARRRGHRRRVVAAAGLVATAAALSLGVVASQRHERSLYSAADTTRIVILPVEGADSAASRESYELLAHALGRWQGITLVDRTSMIAAHGSERPPRSDAQARESAASLGAGRYVRARLIDAGGTRRLWAGLHDVPTDARLAEASIDLAGPIDAAGAVIERLADEILLRSRTPEPGSRVLPAVQLFDSATRALEAGMWRAADTLFLAALEADRTFATAALWLAQVRNWKQERPGSWLTWAERASAGELRSDRERSLAAALLAIGNGDFPRACEIYDALRTADPRDFASWFGTGQCNRLDNVVLRDARSASGWRFRGSSHAAAQAYARAFEMTPALRQNFEARAYWQLRDMLYVDRSRVRRGVGLAPDTVSFLAYPSLAGDTLVHVPYPGEMLVRGEIRVDPGAWSAAAARQRLLFRRVTESWVAAMPNSPGSKEALAISLESDGDPRALEAMTQARLLATDPPVRLRLGVSHTFLLLSFGRTSPGRVRTAVALADSLLSMPHDGFGEHAALLAPVAALMGRCGQASSLAARGVPLRNAELTKLPFPALAAAESIGVLLTLGCIPEAESESARIVESVYRQQSGSGARGRDEIDYDLFGRTIVVADMAARERITRLERVSGDYVLRAQIAAGRNDRAAVRRILGERRRARSGPDLSPDAALAEARAWLAVGDTADAKATLDPILDRSGWLDLMLNSAIGAGSLFRIIALRAALARAEGDLATASRLASLMATAWSRADPELRSRTDSLRRIASG